MGSSTRPVPTTARLWQLPLFVFSLGVFGYAAYLFVDPQPGLAIERKIELARSYLKCNRPEAAADQLNKLLRGERLTLENEAKVHQLLAQSIEGAQRLKGLDLPANHERIIEQSRIAISQGAKPSADTYCRMGESYAALGRPDEALATYRRAEAMDVNRALWLKRKVIELQVARGDAGAAAASLDAYLNDDELSDGERAWALGERSRLLADAGRFLEARGLLGKAVQLDPEPAARGPLHYWLGYCQWKLGDPAGAERLLRVARDLMKARHPADADAAYTLAKIRHEAGDAEEAAAFYESVLVGHPDAPVAVLARLGRGVCRVALGEDDAGLHDLRTLVNDIADQPVHERRIPDVTTGLREAATTLAARKNFDGALEVMDHEQALSPAPAPEFFARLANLLDERSEQVDAAAAAAPNEPERFRRAAHGRDLRTKAGDAHLAYAKAVAGNGLAGRGVTGNGVAGNGGRRDDDEAYGAAIWKAADRYDRAGSIPLTVAVLESFVDERPDHALVPDALLRLGRAYQASGDFERAIEVLHRNRSRYPGSPAASKSGLPLARAYLARGGPDADGKAERVLKAVSENNRPATPDAGADESRQALFALAQLYYRLDRFDEAVARLGEITERYADGARAPQILFLMGDSYRKSAYLLRQTMAAKDAAKAKPAGAKNPAGPPAAGGRQDDDEAARARARTAAAERAAGQAAVKNRLIHAGRLYAQVIEHFRHAAAEAERDKLHLKRSHFYRADCLYDLADYPNAIKHYETAASTYKDDAASLAAQVQIANSYHALGKTRDARAANERAKHLLRRMSPDVFEDPAGGPTLSKPYWEQWLAWTSEAGMFAEGDPAPTHAGVALSGGRARAGTE